MSFSTKAHLWVTWLKSVASHHRRTWNSHVHSPPPALSYTLFKHALLDFALRHHPQRAPPMGASAPRVAMRLGSVSPSKRVSAALHAADAHASFGAVAAASTAAAGTREKLEIRKLFFLTVEALLPAPPAQNVAAARMPQNFHDVLATPPRPPVQTLAQQMQQAQHLQNMQHMQLTPQMQQMQQVQQMQQQPQQQMQQAQQVQQQTPQVQHTQQTQQAQETASSPSSFAPPAAVQGDPTFRYAIDDLASKLHALKADMEANPFIPFSNLGAPKNNK